MRKNVLFIALAALVAICISAPPPARAAVSVNVGGIVHVRVGGCGGWYGNWSGCWQAYVPACPSYYSCPSYSPPCYGGSYSYYPYYYNYRPNYGYGGYNYYRRDDYRYRRYQPRYYVQPQHFRGYNRDDLHGRGGFHQQGGWRGRR